MKSAMLKLLGIALLLAPFVSCKKDPQLTPTESKEVPAQLTPDTVATPVPEGKKDVVETTAPVQVEDHHVINSNCAGFYRAMPALYNSTTKQYPLLVFLHGSYEKGNGTTQLTKVLKNAIPKLLQNKKFPPNFKSGGKNYSFIVASPQFKNSPSTEDVYAVIQYMVDHYRIDISRIYVTGLSLGGGATWSVGAKYATKIAAIVPICGSSSPVEARAEAISSANLPVWAFHNADDPAASVSKTQNYVQLVNSFKPAIKAKMTIWAHGGHDAWTKATSPDYRENGMNMYEWMLQYHR